MDFSDIIAIIEKLPREKDRLIIGIAGPPASGKSTLSQKLVDEIEGSICVPMDGFHLDNDVLDEMGLRHRKGAPNTFDAPGFLELIQDIRSGKLPVSIPEFDRDMDCVVPGKNSVTENHKIIVVEGNYLLLDENPWCQLKELFDFTISLKPDLALVEERILQRWLGYGFDEDEARLKASVNDLPNARQILLCSMQPDLLL